MSDLQVYRTVNMGEKNNQRVPGLFITLFDYSFAVTGDFSTAKVVSSRPVPAGALVIGGQVTQLTQLSMNGQVETFKISLADSGDLLDSDTTTMNGLVNIPLSAIATQLATEKFVTFIRGATNPVTEGILKGYVLWTLPEFISSGH